MKQSQEPFPPQEHQSKEQKPRQDIYSEESVWLCENRKTLYKTRIHGALAQILKKYPNDYKLRLLSTKEPPNEHATATSE